MPLPSRPWSRDLIAYASDRELADEPLQYADFSEWQHERRSAGDETAQAAKARWQEALDGAAPRVPLARVPDSPAALDEVAVPVDAAFTESVAELATRYGSTSGRGDSRGLACIPRAGRRLRTTSSSRRSTRRRDIPTSRARSGSSPVRCPIRTKVPAELTFAELVDQLDGELASAGAQEDWAPADESGPSAPESSPGRPSNWPTTASGLR